MFKTFIYSTAFLLCALSISETKAQEDPFFKINTINQNLTVNCLSGEQTIGVSIENWIPGFEYVWSNGETDSIISVSVNSSRTFDVAIINQEIGFYDNRSFNIDFKNNPIELSEEHFVVSNEFCPGSETPIQVNPTGGHGAFEYNWNNGSDTRSIVVAPLQNTTYKVTVTDECGTQTTTEVLVELEDQNPIISPDQETIEFVCLNKALELAPEMTNVSGGIGHGYQFKFDGQTSNTPLLIEPKDNENIKVNVSDECGINWNEIELKLEKEDAFVPQLDQVAVCSGTEINLTLDEAYKLFYWENNQLFSDKMETIHKDKKVDLVFVDECGDMRDVSRTFKADYAIADWNYTSSPYSNQVLLKAEQSQSAYKWIQENEIIGTERDLQLELENGSETSIILETINENGCVETQERVIVKRSELDVPSAFSPNGDGINDVYSVNIEEELEQFSFKVFDRWGQLLFQTNDQYFEWAAEEIESNEQIQTFAFRLSGVTSTGTNVNESGTITIIKAKR